MFINFRACAVFFKFGQRQTDAGFRFTPTGKEGTGVGGKGKGKRKLWEVEEEEGTELESEGEGKKGRGEKRDENRRGKTRG